MLLQLFMSMDHALKFFDYSISYTVLYSPMAILWLLFVHINPLTSSPIAPHLLPFGNHQNALHIHDSVSLLVCLVCFLDSIVDRYVFIAIYCS